MTATQVIAASPTKAATGAPHAKSQTITLQSEEPENARPSSSTVSASNSGKSLARYRKLFEACRPAVLERGRASLDYPTSVAKTWQISIEAAEGICAAARPLLELLAFFAPDALPEDVLASAPAMLPEGLGDELERDEAIAALHRFSLIRVPTGVPIRC